MNAENAARDLNIMAQGMRTKREGATYFREEALPTPLPQRVQMASPLFVAFCLATNANDDLKRKKKGLFT